MQFFPFYLRLNTVMEYGKILVLDQVSLWLFFNKLYSTVQPNKRKTYF